MNTRECYEIHGIEYRTRKTYLIFVDTEKELLQASFQLVKNGCDDIYAICWVGYSAQEILKLSTTPGNHFERMFDHD